MSFSLATLPEDILLALLVSFQDLPSHLSFSTSCRRIHRLYDEPLWRRVALSFGLGKPLDLAIHRVSWRTICSTAVVHSSICKLPDCSEQHLCRGREEKLLRIPYDLILTPRRVYEEQAEVILSSVFDGMMGDLEDLYSTSIPCNIRKERTYWRVPDYLESKAFLGREGRATLIAHHFPASAALATVPGVTRLTVLLGEYTVDVSNDQGVCVWDVVGALTRKMLEIVPPRIEETKPAMRIYQVIAQEWRQQVLLRFSMHGLGNVEVHLDIGEEIAGRDSEEAV
ncbi:hypothetical protein M422DRAFT_776591, partial [Sphaerobolus stellatus SS14]